MDKLVLLPSLALAGFLVIWYLIRCYRGAQAFNVAVVVSIVIQSAGAVVGVLLAASSIHEPLRPLIKELDLYIFIAGLAVFLVSLQGLGRDLLLSVPKKGEF